MWALTVSCLRTPPPCVTEARPAPSGDHAAISCPCPPLTQPRWVRGPLWVPRPVLTPSSLPTAAEHRPVARGTAARDDDRAPGQCPRQDAVPLRVDADPVTAPGGHRAPCQQLEPSDAPHHAVLQQNHPETDSLTARGLAGGLQAAGALVRGARWTGRRTGVALEKGMGRKAGRAGGQSGARRGRDQIPRSTPHLSTPSPSMRQLPACFFFTVARPKPLLTPAPPAPSHQTSPRGAFCARGFISVTPPLRPGSLAHQGTAWVRKDLRRLKKWVGDGLALFLHAVSHSRQLAAGDV